MKGTVFLDEQENANLQYQNIQEIIRPQTVIDDIYAIPKLHREHKGKTKLQAINLKYL